MEIRKGIIRAYDAANHEADVQLIGSMATRVDGVPVAHHLGAELIAAGTMCAVLFFKGDPGVVVCTWEGTPPAWITSSLIKDGEVAVGDLAFDPATQSELNAHTGAKPFDAHSGNPSCKAYHSADQSISSGAWATLSMNSEYWDNDGMHDLVTNNSRITIQTGGYYLIGARVEWAVNGTGRRMVSLRVNGTGTRALDSRAALSGGNVRQGLVDLLNRASSDYVEVLVYQDSGGALDVKAIAGSSPMFWAVRIL